MNKEVVITIRISIEGNDVRSIHVDDNCEPAREALYLVRGIGKVLSETMIKCHGSTAVKMLLEHPDEVAEKLRQNGVRKSNWSIRHLSDRLRKDIESDPERYAALIG